MYVNEETEEQEEEIIMAEAKDPGDIFRKHLNEARQEQLDEVLPLIAGAAMGLARAGAVELAKRGISKIAGAFGKKAAKKPLGKTGVGKKPGRLARRGLGGGEAGADGEASDNNDSKYRETEPGEFTKAGRAKHTVSAAGRVSSDLTGAHIDRQRNKVAWQMEENFKTIKKLAESTGDPTVINFGKETITINNRIASKVMKVYEQLNKENKQKLKSMLGESTETFRKAINFVVRQG
jgi:hypothetical protein